MNLPFSTAAFWSHWINGAIIGITGTEVLSALGAGLPMPWGAWVGLLCNIALLMMIVPVDGKSLLFTWLTRRDRLLPDINFSKPPLLDPWDNDDILYAGKIADMMFNGLGRQKQNGFVILIFPRDISTPDHRGDVRMIAGGIEKEKVPALFQALTEEIKEGNES